MYLSRIRLRPDATRKSGFWERFSDTYEVHQEVWRLFADHADRSRDFLYRLEQAQGLPRIFALSTRLPEDPDGLWDIEPNIFQPVLEDGDRLRFCVRVNPVVKRDNKRCDVVMNAKKELKVQNVPRDQWPPLPQIVQEKGSHWLAQRMEKHGFEIDENALRVDRYDIRKFRKNGRQVTIASCDFDGILQVTRPEDFRQCLTTGLGPAKAFGCGLMLCARVKR